jgi:hypothetical protein
MARQDVGARDSKPGVSRRAFLGRSALAAGGVVVSLAALDRLGARAALADSGRDRHGDATARWPR